MTHDPILDDWLVGLDADPNYSDYLTLIARVRETWYGAQAETWDQGYDAAIDDAYNAVRRMSGSDMLSMDATAWVPKAVVLALIESLSPEADLRADQPDSGGE